jgi:hypothetical protein
MDLSHHKENDPGGIQRDFLHDSLSCSLTRRTQESTAFSLHYRP